MPEIIDRLRLALPDRYRIEKELGAGGMATVYLAEDLKHGRPVAIKVLDPDLAATTIGGERFLREIRITAALSHPNILALIDSGDADGLLYYVMPFVNGESLRQRIDREKQLPIADALDIAEAVASALAFAHRQGVIHRDIKPENILLSPEAVLVADFGIARPIQSGAGQMTETGLALGTPGYMSPEQAMGEQTLDARSDVYSLGCLLYEMTVGEPPFTGPTTQAIVARALSGSIPAARATRETVPEAVDDVIKTALSRSPADRYSDAGKFAEALAAARHAVPRKPSRFRRPTRAVVAAFAGGVAVVAAAAAVVAIRYSSAEASTPSLVVLPFENLGKADDAGFADGVTDEITAKLADVQGLTVKTRQSALAYRGTTKTPQQIAHELKVDYILGATLSWEQRPDGQRRVRVRPQLIRGKDGKSLWANAFDEDVTQVFVVQANIANQVVAALTPAIVAQAGNPAGGGGGRADAAGYYKAALTRAIPQDPELHTGRLDNGLRYYIRNNNQPDRRVDFKLIVANGSVIEGQGQHGYAHLMQHLALASTPPFGDGLISYLQSLGARYGNDVNGSVTHDRTEIYFRVPTQRAGVADTAVHILRNFASEIQIDQRSLDRARKVMFEEWRTSRAGGAGQVNQRLFTELLNGLPEADHEAFGDSATIARAEPAALARFYHDSYRPDQMAVVIVGDIAADSAEALVRKYFADFKPSGKGIAPPAATFPDRRETRVSVISSPGNVPSLCLCYLQRADTALTIGAYRQDVVRRLFVSLLEARFAERASEPNAPFLQALISRSLITPRAAFMALNIAFADSGGARALEGTTTEAERVARYGFTNGEIERAKAKLLRTMQQSYDERSKQTSVAYATAYSTSFIDGSPVLGIAFEFGLFKRFLPTIDASEIRALGREWLADRNRTVIALLNAKAGARTSESDLHAVLQTINLDDIKPYEERVVHAALPTTTKSGTITREEKMPVVDATSWTLSNGARVILKATDFKSDEIVMQAYRMGGTSLANDADFNSAAVASAIAMRSGFGDLTALDVQRSVADKVASLSPAVGELIAQFTGKTSPRDAEAFLRLVALHFTPPRRDTVVFQTVMTQLHTMYAARSKTPATVFDDSVIAIMANGLSRLRPFGEVRLDSIHLDRALAFYRSQFGDAGGFTFVFVGSLDMAAMRPLVEKYIGGLPGGEKHAGPRDIGYHPPSGIVRKAIRVSDTQQAFSNFAFTGPFAFTAAERQAVRSVADVLRERLRERLREQLGAVYDARVTTTYERDPRPTYRFDIRFASAPERTDELVAATLKIIADLAANGPTADELAKVRAVQRQTKETNVRDNSYWAQNLLAVVRYNSEPQAIFGFELIDGLTAASIRDATQRYLPADRYVLITSKP